MLAATPLARVAWAITFGLISAIASGSSGIPRKDSAMLLRYAVMRLSHLVPMVLVVTMVVFFVMW